MIGKGLGAAAAAMEAIHRAIQDFDPQREDEDNHEQEEEEEESSPMEDPRNQDEDGTLYLDKNLFEYKCQKGDTVMIKGTVKSVGSKIGIVPEEVVHEKNEEHEEHKDTHDDHEDEENEENEYEGNEYDSERGDNGSY